MVSGARPLRGSFNKSSVGPAIRCRPRDACSNAMAFPTVRAYDPAYSYETAVIIFDGLKRMYEDDETAIYPAKEWSSRAQR